ncbi:Sec-independent protein translocase subunit TatA/TatB [Pontiella sulfatireligans]|uniref:Sec-independent protein translocase protein TatA n=1 Tax=Pontiella sulfatireligans TaxID=2750658 RepID=A0A6C2UNC8_9BACT|nr:hypothetical protein [Pontiella sulfatireligans]VGO20781.1 hypothetical protein SCARR_02848 [Pontiella sulfatireligans]
MIEAFSHMAYLGPGGPEFLVIMLVLLIMFGSKDAPRILRKINEIINQVRNTADSFKREVMYGDLNSNPPSYASTEDDDGEHDSDYDYGDEDYYDQDDSDETFDELEKDLEKAEADAEETDVADDAEIEETAPEKAPAEAEEGNDDDRKA